MNNRILQMVIRQVVLVLTMKGVNAFFSAREQKARENDRNEGTQPRDPVQGDDGNLKLDQRRTRQQMRNLRRFTRF